MNKTYIDISWLTLWRVSLFALLMFIMFIARDIFLGLFLALVISSGFENFINMLEKKGLPRPVSVIFVFVSGAVGLVAFVYLIVPFFVVDIARIIATFTESAGELGFAGVTPDVFESITNFVTRISATFFSSATSSPLAAFANVLGGIGLVIAVFVSSFYLSLSRDGVERFIRAVFPADVEEAALRIYARSRTQIALWFHAQIILSVVVGFLTWAGLMLLGVEHALLIGLLAAVLEIVPYVGPILSGAAGVLVAFAASPLLALYTLFLFLVIQQLENNILVPLVMKRSVGLHPVVVIIALLAGAEVLGLLGMLIAVPAAAVFQEVIEEWSREKKSRAARAT